MSETIQARSPKQAKSIVRAALNSKRPLFLWGPPGIGKSDIVHQIGNDMGAYVQDVRLSLWEPTDIKGIPHLNPSENKMVWAPPSELPGPAKVAELAEQGIHNIILFLDELNSAPPAVQAAAYQLILNRKVGQYELPDNVLIVAAGNRDSDKGVTYRMPSPLANRFVHCEMTHDFNDWFEWAANHRVHPDVIGFLSANKGQLMNFDPRSPSHSFATPRSWSYVSEFLNDDTIDQATMTALVEGSVGEGTGNQFMAHRANAAFLPHPEDVLNGTVDTLDERCQISAQYSLITSLCYEMKLIVDQNNGQATSDFHSSMNHFITFSLKNFETELVVMGIKLALTQYSLPLDPDKTPAFDDFHDKYGKYISAAQR